MPETNELVRFHEPGDVSLVEEPIPDLASGQVLTRTTLSMVSIGTELAVLVGEFEPDSHWADYADYPFDTGYMNVGVVERTADDVDGVAVGDRVVSYSPHARYNAVDADTATVVPDHVTDTEAVFFSAAEIAMNGLRRGRLDWGESAAVFGLGLIGQLAVRFALHAGAQPVFAVNRSTGRFDFLPDHDRLVTASTTDDDWIDVVADGTDGRLADVVVEATGNADAVTTQLDALRHHGRMVVLGSPEGATEFNFHDDVSWPCYDIVGAHVKSHATTETARTPWTQDRHRRLFFSLLDDPLFADLDELVTREAQHTDAVEIYRDLQDHRSDELGVLLHWE
jgi:threonine dehydrogenase-like Zn-dependent dehydrogenase